MKIVNVSSTDLESFKSGSKFNKISALSEKIIKEIPLEIKVELKYRKINLDYFINEIEVPKFTIPYCFDTRDFSENLKIYFEEYIIFVEW